MACLQTNGSFLTLVKVLYLSVCLQALVASEYTGTYDYGVFIDAGSQGSRIYVYRWPERDFKILPPPESAPLEEVGSQKSLNRKAPGIATVNPSDVHDYLKPLIEQAALLLESEGLDEDDLHEVPLYLFATAGMRVLPADNQKLLLQSIREYAQDCGFQYKEERFRVISGEEEGVFGWLTVNYLKNTFAGLDSHKTVGALDLGGASTQITFQPPSSQPILQGLFPFRLTEELQTNLYTHSYLYLGLTEARQQHYQRMFLATESLLGDESTIDPVPVLQDPCAPINCKWTYVELKNKKGQVVHVQVNGTSNATGCSLSLKSLLESLKLSAEQCLHHDHSDCALLGVYQPPLSGPSAVEMYAFSGFVYTWQFFEMDQEVQADLQALNSKTHTVCSKNLADLTAYNANLTHPQNADYLDTFCFSANYITALLEIGYGMERVNTPLKVVSEINGSSVSYAFGAMLYEVNQLPWTYEEKNRMASSEVACWIILGTITSVLSGLCIFLLIMLRRERAQKYGSSNSNYSERLLLNRT